MKLSRLRLRRAPGLDKGLGELRFEAGLNVVFGPNESGKTTIARAIQSTLWPEGRKPGALLDVDSDWSEGDRAWSAHHDGTTSWTLGGELAVPPDLPGDENSPAYRLHLRDLIADGGEGPDDFARRVRAALDGGYDLTARRTPLRSNQYGRSERGALGKAERHLAAVEAERADIAREVDGLSDLEARKQAADAAKGEAERLERAIALRDASAALADARAALARDATPDLGGHELETLRKLLVDLDECDRDAQLRSGARDAARAELTELALPDPPPEAAHVGGWLADARALVELERDRDVRRAAVAPAAELEVRAREALGARSRDDAGEDDASPLFQLTGAEVDTLAGWLEKRASIGERRRAAEARRSQLERSHGEEATGADEPLAEDALRRARDRLAAALARGPGAASPLTGALVAGAAAAALIELVRAGVIVGVDPLPVVVVPAVAIGTTILGKRWGSACISRSGPTP